MHDHTHSLTSCADRADEIGREMAVISTHCASPDVYPPVGHYSYYVQTGQGDILQGQDRGL